jgi:hypothetical protein
MIAQTLHNCPLLHSQVMGTSAELCAQCSLKHERKPVPPSAASLQHVGDIAFYQTTPCRCVKRQALRGCSCVCDACLPLKLKCCSIRKLTMRQGRICLDRHTHVIGLHTHGGTVETHMANTHIHTRSKDAHLNSSHDCVSGRYHTSGPDAVSWQM